MSYPTLISHDELNIRLGEEIKTKTILPDGTVLICDMMCVGIFQDMDYTKVSNTATGYEDIVPISPVTHIYNFQLIGRTRLNERTNTERVSKSQDRNSES